MRENETKVDVKTGKFRECDECWAAIQHVLSEYNKEPFETDDVIDEQGWEFVTSLGNEIEEPIRGSRTLSEVRE